MKLAGETRLNVGDRRSEGAAFEAGSDRDRLSQSLAVNLGLAGVVVDSRDLIDSDVAVRRRRADRESAQVIEPRTRTAEQHADAGGASVLDHVRNHVAAEGG